MSPKNFSRNIVILISLFAISCSTVDQKPKKQAKGKKTEKQSSQTLDSGINSKGQDAAERKEIQSLFSHAAYEAVIKRSAVFEKKFPKSPHLPQVLNLHGLAFLSTNRAEQSVEYFQKAVETNSSSNFKPYVLYNLATAQFDTGLTDEAQQTLSEIHPESLDRDNRIKLHGLRARLDQKLELPAEAVRELLTLSRLLDNADPSNPFAAQLEQNLQSLNDIPLLESIYSEFQDSPFADRVLFQMAKQQINDGRLADAHDNFRIILNRFPKSPHYADAQNALSTKNEDAASDNKAVGLLLPLTGKFSSFGSQAAHAIELAFNVFNHDEPDSKITLILADSGETPEQAIKGLEELYFKHGTIAVIGPLMSKGVDQITQKAQDLGLPIMPLSQQPGVKADYVFPFGLTVSQQAREIARYAIQNLKLGKFAVLHSRDKFGEQYSQHYWDAVESLGGSIVAIESYNPGETDFRQAVDKLSGLYYTEARHRELDALAEERKAGNIKKRTRKTEQFFSLKPIVDYEAVFIADEPKIAAQIFPTFAYRDVDKVKFLGTASWQSPELLTRAQHYAEGVFFVDAFVPDSSAQHVKTFIQRYENTFKTAPGSMEAIAYDAGRLLYHVLASEPKKRSELRDELKQISNFPGVSGKISYKNDEFTRSLAVLTVKGGKIVETQ